MLSSEQEIELKALYEPMLQTKILPNFHSFPYLLMSSSRGKVKPRAVFLGGDEADWVPLDEAGML